uniref:Putative exonuclease n=1 Tax=viral metagenome TaxID=1070528 RepID=A0A6M3LV35_9ZZZZ
MNEILIIVDCNYLGFVNKYALSEGLTYRGGRTEIVFGFFRQILEIAKRFETTHFAFCWDSKESLRKKIFPDYKANRHKEDRSEEEKSSDIEVFKQFDEIRLIGLKLFGFENIFHKEGYEGDDLMASIVKMRQGINIVISTDNDLFQLLDFCSLYNLSKKEMTTKKIFTCNYSIEPDQWVEVKALAGCKSDYVPGIPGVGEKTAIKYLKGELKSSRTLEKIQSSDSIIKRNRTLVSLPLEGLEVLPLRKAKKNWTVDQFISFCKHYGFQSFLREKTKKEWIKTFHMS